MNPLYQHAGCRPKSISSRVLIGTSVDSFNAIQCHIWYNLPVIVCSYYNSSNWWISNAYLWQIQWLNCNYHQPAALWSSLNPLVYRQLVDNLELASQIEICKSMLAFFLLLVLFYVWTDGNSDWAYLKAPLNRPVLGMVPRHGYSIPPRVFLGM